MAERKDKDYIIRLASEISAKVGAEVGAEVALKTFAAEVDRAKAERVDRRLYNTKLLLKNYRMFKVSAENAVYDAANINEDVLDILDLMTDRWQDGREALVESIRESAARTAAIVAHVDTMLGIYESFCAKKGPNGLRRWNVIQGLYIAEQPLTMHELANSYYVDERSIYRYVDTAVAHLAALIFGIDGVRRK